MELVFNEKYSKLYKACKEYPVILLPNLRQDHPL